MLMAHPIISRVCESAMPLPKKGSNVVARDSATQILHPCRRLIKEGHVLSEDGKLRLLLLFNDHALLCKAKGKKVSVLLLLRCI